MVQSGSTFLQILTACWRISSNRASSASRVSFWVMKLTVAELTPGSFLMASSILAAQLAQSRSWSLKCFFMVISPLQIIKRIRITGLCYSTWRGSSSATCSMPWLRMVWTWSSARA